MAESDPQSTWDIPGADASSLGGGRYRLAAKLGEGGMAAVYRAWDTEAGDWRAIKVLLPEFARRGKVRKRFSNEARTMLRLDHRHIVTVYDVNTEEALPYIVMELAGGGCLIDWVQRYGPMPPRMAVDVIMQVCKGLNAAHDLGVIHRDVKPHNVLITHRGVCRITDFGIAQHEDAGMTKTGSVMGTLGYMAPEQRTDSKAVDVRADVYGLGATLYKLLTGGAVADLFLAEHDASMLDGVPDVLVPVLLRSTAYKPDQRFPTVADLARALHEARRDLPPDPPDVPPLAMPIAPGTSTTLDNTPISPATFLDLPAVPDDPSAGTLAPPPVPPRLATPAPAPRSRVDQMRAAESEDLPDYLDPESLADGETQRARAFSDRLDARDSDRARTAAAKGLAATDDRRLVYADSDEEGEAEEPQKVDTGGLFDTFVEVVAEMLRLIALNAMKPLKYVAVIGTVFAVIFGISVGQAAKSVNAAMSVALDGREALYAIIDENEPIKDDLEALGGERAVLDSFWFDYTRADAEPARMEAAYKLIGRLNSTEKYVKQFGNAEGRSHKVAMARERLNRIEMAQHEYEAKMLAWEKAADQSSAQLAIQLGLAQRPDS